MTSTGDGICDPENNFASCGDFDGGDCQFENETLSQTTVYGRCFGGDLRLILAFKSRVYGTQGYSGYPNWVSNTWL